MIKKLLYLSPRTWATEITHEACLMQSEFVGGGSGALDIDDLGATDTDPGNAVWN